MQGFVCSFCPIMRRVARRKPACRATALVAAFLSLAASLPAQLQPPNLQPSDKPDAVLITVTRFGPYPATISHSGLKPFVLCLVNRSGVLDDTFSLVQGPVGVAAVSLLDLHSTAAKQRDHAVIFPLPGTYRMIFQSHPGWSVTFNITAN